MRTEPKAVTMHALGRYMERSGAKKQFRAIRRLFGFGVAGLPIGRNRYYAKGWIVVITRGVIKTAYKPTTPEQMAAIYSAMRCKEKTKCTN